jgi:erythromycin esterase
MADARHAIEAQYVRLGEAVANKDLDAIRALLAAEYTQLEVTGEERDLAAVMAEWRYDFADMIEPSLQTEIQSVALDGNQAVVAARSVQAFVTEFAASRRYNNRIETMRSDDWTNTAAGWRLARSQIQAVKSWIDGELDRNATFEPALTAEQRAAVVRDLRARVLPFDSVHAGSGFDDLAGLDRLIGDARIVALGEATHGSAEIFQMKHRLLEYLVERKGFTVFAIEGNWPEAQVGDRFVKTGEGDAGAALTAIYYWTCQSQEVSALLQWMRQYNATRGERPVVSFSGFDMQVRTVAMKRVIDCLDRIDSADRDTVRALYDGMEKLDKWGTGISAEENTRLADRAREALDLIDARRTTLTTASTPEEYRDVRQAARIVLQGFERGAGIADRERAMAENVSWLLEQAFPGQKIVLWAHNGHVGTGMEEGGKSMGDHLRDRYAEQMVTIGFATHHGTVRARRLEPGKVGPLVAGPLAPARKVSVEAVFADTGLPRFILELRNLPKDGAVGVWLSKPRLHRMIGAVYDAELDSKYYIHVRLPAMYDGIVFIAETTAAQPLP